MGAWATHDAVRGGRPAAAPSGGGPRGRRHRRRRRRTAWSAGESCSCPGATRRTHPPPPSTVAGGRRERGHGGSERRRPCPEVWPRAWPAGTGGRRWSTSRPTGGAPGPGPTPVGAGAGAGARVVPRRPAPGGRPGGAAPPAREPRPATGRVVLTTPDRSVVDPDRPLGPPTDMRQRRAWTDDQLELLLLSCGLDVERRWRLPGPGTSTWGHRLASRWPRLPVPGVRRSTLAVLARRRGGARSVPPAAAATEPPPSV